MSVTVKKLRLIPCGDKEEVNRVYEYLRNGIYNQYRILNTYMSQLGTLYYSCDRNIKDPRFIEGQKEIFRNTNTAIHDIEQAKGLGMAGSCGMKVKQDFSTALKNGLARGERQLPYYKRDFPLLVPGRFLVFSSKEETYKDNDGKEKTVTNYYIKSANGINYKVVMGSKGARDYYLSSLLDNLVNSPEHYSVGGSSIQLSGSKIILNLTVKIDKEIAKYIPTKNKKMSLVLGYDQPLVAVLSDDKSETEYYIGDDISESIVLRRQAMQEMRTRLQASQKYSRGGHGRNRKLRKSDQIGSYEKNVMRNFNHILSSKVVSFAVKHNIETLVIDDITKDDLADMPIVLRNWSYYQLVQYIEYKAARVGISVIKSSVDAENLCKCCKCGEEIPEITPQTEKASYSEDLFFTCPGCGKKLSYRYNKAFNLLNELKKKK